MQVCSHPTRGQGRSQDRIGVPRSSAQGGPLSHPHDPAPPLGTFPAEIPCRARDNGIQFAEQPRNRNAAYSRQMRFDMIYEANGIEHRLTKPNHPCTNGQVERMNRTILDATVKRCHCDSHYQPRTHLAGFIDVYNFARRLKRLSGLTPYEYCCKIWTSEPDQFILNQIHQMPGQNTWRPNFRNPCFIRDWHRFFMPDQEWDEEVLRDLGMAHHGDFRMSVRARRLRVPPLRRAVQYPRSGANPPTSGRICFSAKNCVMGCPI